MAQTSILTMAKALFDAGFRGDSIVTMVAIALGESGGDSASICDSCLGVSEYSVGLWQINLQAHPDVTKECALDPTCAAKAAYAISGSGTNFAPWSQYTNGGYTQYLDQVKAVINKPLNSASDFLAVIPDADVVKALLKADQDIIDGIIGLLPHPFSDIIAFLPDTAIQTILDHVPMYVLRLTIPNLPPNLLARFFLNVPGFDSVAPVVTDIGGGIVAADQALFKSIWGFTMPATKELTHIVGIGLIIVVGIGLVMVGAFGVASKSETVKTTINTGAKVAGTAAKAAVLA